MPNDPSPDWLNLTPPVKNRPPKKPKSPKRPRTRKDRSSGENSFLPYWIAGGLVVLLVLLMALDWEAPVIKGWFVKREAPPAKPPISPQLTAEEERRQKLKEKAAEETRLLVERTAPRPVPSPGPVA